MDKKHVYLGLLISIVLAGLAVGFLNFENSEPGQNETSNSLEETGEVPEGFYEEYNISEDETVSICKDLETGQVIPCSEV